MTSRELENLAKTGKLKVEAGDSRNSTACCDRHVPGSQMLRSRFSQSKAALISVTTPLMRLPLQHCVGTVTDQRTIISSFSVFNTLQGWDPKCSGCCRCAMTAETVLSTRVTLTSMNSS